MSIQRQPPREPLGYAPNGVAVTISRSWYRFLTETANATDDVAEEIGTEATGGGDQLAAAVYALQVQLEAAVTLANDLAAQVHALRQQVEGLQAGAVQ